jgi:uncharacterized protein YcfL
MQTKWIFLLLLSLFCVACSGNSSDQEVDPELQEEIETLESTAEELEAAKESIDSSASQLDSLLNEF